MTNQNSSPDGYVRVPVETLETIRLRHLVSEKDFSIAVPHGPCAGAKITGFTEWIGSWRNAEVTVGWDWGVVEGVVVVLNPQEIRTNIQLVNDEQRLEPVSRATAQMLRWIESFPWRQEGIDQLLVDDLLDGPD